MLGIDWCPSLLSIAVINTMTESNPEGGARGGSVHFTACHAGKSGQELEQKPGGRNRSRGPGGLPLTPCLSLFSYTVQDYPGPIISTSSSAFSVPPMPLAFQAPRKAIGNVGGGVYADKEWLLLLLGMSTLSLEGLNAPLASSPECIQTYF